MARSRGAGAVGWIIATLAGVVLASGIASAHVRFVTSTEDVGDALQFLLSALTDPVNLAVLSGGGVATLVAIAVYLRISTFDRDIAVFRGVMEGYHDLLPWLLRLGFGLPLVGAGFAGYFFNPVVDPMIGGGVDRLLQILLGFLILFGLATRAAAAVGLLVYLVSLTSNLLLVFSLEWIPGFLALILLGSGRPSADHVLNHVAEAPTFYNGIDPVHRAADWFDHVTDPYERYAPTIIRVGMGAAFVLLGLLEKLLAPEMAMDVVEQYGFAEATPFSPELWVIGAGFGELALGIAILVGLFTRGSALAAIGVFTLTLFAIPDDPVLAHIGLFSLASALLITGSGPYAVDNWNVLDRTSRNAPSTPVSEPEPELDET